MAPQNFIGCAVTSEVFGPPRPLCGIPRLKPGPRGRTLATLTLPYGYPSRGNVTRSQVGEYPFVAAVG